VKEKGKSGYGGGILGNPADMGIAPRTGRDMVLSGPLAGEQSTNKQTDKHGQKCMWANAAVKA